jgi:hypothetical protein
VARKDLTPGDLAILDGSKDVKGLYLELRSSNNKITYSFPRQIIDQDDLLLILKVECLDVLVYSSSGKCGWITANSLEVVSKFTS